MTDLNQSLTKIRDFQSSAIVELEALMAQTPQPVDTKILDINHMPQKGPGADRFGNDCGPTAAGMIIRAFHPNNTLTPDQLFPLATGDTEDDYVSVTELRKGLFERFGIATNYLYTMDVEAWIDAGLGVVALLLYEPFQKDFPNPDSNFDDMHFLVIAGYRPDEFYVLDPLWLAGGRWVPRSVVYDAWASGSPANRAIVTAAPIWTVIDEIKNVEVTWSRDLNIRAAPGITARIVGTAKFKRIYQVYEIDTQPSGDVWAKIGEGKWMAMEYGGRILSKLV